MELFFKKGDYLFGLGYSENFINHQKRGYNKISNEDDNAWTGTSQTAWKPDPFYNSNIDKYTQSGPILFYKKKSVNLSNFIKDIIINNNSYLSNTYQYSSYSGAFNSTINAIPLSDIFDVIRYSRVDAGWKKYGL
jgi:hypothetical protein